MRPPRRPTRPSAAAVLEQAGHHGRMLGTILRSGVVPGRLHRGLPLLPSLVRYGTTMTGLYAGVAAAIGDRAALVDDRGSVSYAELDRRVVALAAGLAAEHGLREGDVVGLLATNHIGFVEALLACGRIGAHVVLLNTGMSAAQAALVTAQQGVVLLVADGDLLPLLEEVGPDVTRLVADDPEGGAGSTAALVAAHAGAPCPPRPREHGRTVVMTSGTTGAPKGARRPASGGVDSLASILSCIPMRADGTTLILPPLFHTWGLANLQMAAAMRATVVLRRRFDPQEAMVAASSHRVEVMAVVPVMLQRILEVDAGRARDLSALRIVASSGSALPGPLATRWMEAHGPTLYNLYGSTEVSWATIAGPEDLAACPGTAGRAPMGTVLRIIGEDGREAPTGEVGRIFVGNGLQFEGYTGDVPGKEVIDGLMSTGDVGHLDADGRLFVAGRDDDMIVSGGENVYPKEVEDLLAGRDDLRDVAVIGVDDEEFGQRLVAFVVPTDPDGPPAAEEVRAFVRANLASFSVPREVRVLDELPRNPTGKVVTRELRAMLGG